MAESKEFKLWLRRTLARKDELERELNASVERQVDPANVKIEIRRGGKWVEVPEDELGD